MNPHVPGFFVEVLAAWQFVGNAITALNKVDVALLGLDSDQIKQIDTVVAIFNKALSRAQCIFDAAGQLYADRDQDLLVAATIRLSQISNEEVIIKFKLRSLPADYAAKTKELREKMFSEAEIEKIVTKPDAEMAECAKALDDLTAESKKIIVFLGDSPRYDTAILNSTKVFDVLEVRNALGLHATIAR
ncbi:hypothetical protein ACH50O_02955 [Methylomonas sp. 2BW1-5-20]|uniref:hypothetical protein n=1 Tax=Methylomonas sp. 2BW1-5-20 TaxID=3376686 RepID=UPI00404CF55F